MNNPEYILVDEFGTKDSSDVLTDGILFNVKQALNLPVLNYQYGYLKELKETLAQYSVTHEFEVKKFPLVWVVQPFSIIRGIPGWYGSLDNLQIFIIQATEKTLKASERMVKTFKPVIYPIYREILNQLVLATCFDQKDVDTLAHKITDRYWWGEDQQKIIDDVFDCMEISQLKLKISNNLNSQIFKSF